MEKLKRKNGVSYRAKIRVNDQTFTKVFKTSSEAKDWKAEMLLKRKNGLLSNSTTSEISFKDYFDKWMSTKEKLAVNTKRSYLDIYKIHFAPLFANRKLKSFTMDDGDLLKEKLGTKNLSNARKKTIVVLFKQLFGDAVKRRLLAINQVQYLELYRVTPPPIVIWSKEEIESFLVFHKNHEAIELLFFTLNTGVRLGEVMGLKWNKVNFETKEFKIDSQRNRNGFVENSTKTHTSLVFPMSDAIYLLLKKLYSESRNSEYVFARRDGKIFCYEHFTQRVLYKMIEDAKINKISFHKLRHTFASHFASDVGDIFLSVSFVESCFSRYDIKAIFKAIKLYDGKTS